jgi:hypothetical protein
MSDKSKKISHEKKKILTGYIYKAIIQTPHRRKRFKKQVFSPLAFHG